MVIGKWLAGLVAARDEPVPTLVDDGSMAIRARDAELLLWATLDPVPAGDPHRIYLHKDRRFLSALASVVDRVAPKRIVEIGILNGGSTIYWAERYNVERMIAFELSPEAPFLTQYLERHGLTDRVRVHFGVSQDDKPRILGTTLHDLGGAAIDAVIDDACHWYRETRTTFETLFPLVRPGGAYIIEDWAWGHHKGWPPSIWTDRPLMSPLLTELMLICGKGDGIVDRIDIDTNFAVIWRGNAPAPVNGSFNLADHYVSRGFSVSL